MAAIAAFFSTSDDNGHLKAELQNLRRKGALRPSADWDSTGPDPDRSCGRCRVELGRVINRGAYCRACRLKVCKGCREYSLRTTDWVCTVCHKHMEIQAASGEWMNEFVRRPSRRRDNRVYVPAADIIKRTIRRSWTISNPTPRWSMLRGSPELRPYNSLPRGQDINNYPALINHRANNAEHKPCRRTHSEDVYTERPKEETAQPATEKPLRVNPLMKLGEQNRRQKSPRRKSAKSAEEARKPPEKRVSFDSSVAETEDGPVAVAKHDELHFAKEETAPVELCDIEPLSGTVFRKVTVRRRRQDVRKISTIDTGWRRTSESDLVDILLPDGDDYKLVFLSSDSSSKEEDDSSSTASSFPIDECDWDYFEPGAIRPKQPEPDLALQCLHPRKNCKNCGASAQFIPIPVPVPVPFPVWTSMSRAALIWPLITGEKTASSSGEDAMPEPRNEPLLKEAHSELSGYVQCEGSSDSSVDSDSDVHVQRVYNVNASLGGRMDSDEALPSSNVTSDDEAPEGKNDQSSSTSTSESSDSDSDSNDTGTDQKSKRFSKTYVVNKDLSCSSSSNEITSSDNDTDTELDCTVVLTHVKQLHDGEVVKELELADQCDSSPALSDVDSSESDRVKTPPADLVVNNEDATIRSAEDVVVGVTHGGDEGEWAGVQAPTASVPTDSECGASRNARYTSLVMITQEPAPTYQQVSVVTSDTTTLVPDNDVIVRHTNHQQQDAMVADNHNQNDDDVEEESVTVITGGETLSAFEEGLADDDSWVENLSHDEDMDSNLSDSSGEEVMLTCSATDQEDELRGYHRQAIDFKLHTIVEESCEESEVEQSMPKNQLTTDLEKYFFYRLGDGTNATNREEAFSETSSICSEGPDSLGTSEEPQDDKSEYNELASSRLEKYFLHGFMGFRRDSDGSVGSDSEGRPSPEQRRKKLVRARGTGRSHSSSLDNLLANPDLTSNDQNTDVQSEHSSSSSDSDTYDESNVGEKNDAQFDTVKRKKASKKNQNKTELETTQEEQQSEEDEDRKTPQPEVPSNLTTNKNQQSRDSGFVGSCDDLLKEQKEADTPKHELKLELENITEERTKTYNPPPATSLTRKDSFNNWSSDEETNLMMCKMRQFFKTMVANSQSKPTTPNLSSRSPKPMPRKRCKPPQLVYFENELTRLMKTVPGLRDDQVREIVEYLSSEDTWSDSYDSSDYTSSDLESTHNKSALQQEISDSCKEIINKFDSAVIDDEGDEGDGGIEAQGLNRETAFVYQKLVASFEKIATGDSLSAAAHNSPPLIAKVMHHIGSRLVALMHEVSSGESHASNSPKTRHYHKRLQQKISSTSSTTEDDDSTSDNNLPETLAEVNFNLPRSRSHDLLVGESRMPHSGASDIAEEREVSDCERFSWRGSFESALLADSRNKLSLIGEGGSASASALAIAAKRRSAGDLHFKSLSREQLDRVRSCGSIGGASSEDKLWTTRPTRRRSSVPDATCGSGGSADGEEDDEEEGANRATLPRSLQSGTATTNSLPRLPTTGPTMQKAQSMYHFLPPNAKSARYRPPGFNKVAQTVPKRAASAPGLQHQRRGRRSQQHNNVPSDDVSISEAHSSPMLAPRNGSKSATPSPVAPPSRTRNTATASNQDWPSHHRAEDDIDRLVVMHQTRSSLSSLGLRSDSMASVYSGAGEGRYGTVVVRGQVEFGLQYNYKASALEICVKQCKDLAPVDAKRNRSDPYVKVYLLPDKSKSGKRKTKVKKHTLNPVFDETLKFQISLNGLETRTLWLTVWHSDMFGRNDFLGEVMMTLENKVFDDPAPQWYNLQERTEPFDDMLSFKGDIIVCLKFVPPDMTVQKKGKRSRGTLHVLVKEAKSLTAVKANGTSDPFCKSYLLPDKGRSAKQKTGVTRRTVNPVWNHTFIYEDVTLQELTERCLELTVWDHDRLASNEFLGGVRFSLGTGKHYGKNVDWMDATGKEMSLWKSMLERPNFWVEGCLSLRPSLDTRCS